MRIIKASRGTPEDLIDAVESKIAELEGEGASTTIKADTGTPEDLMYAVTDKIAEIEGVSASRSLERSSSVDATTRIQASYSIDEILDFLSNKGYDRNADDVRNFASAVKEYLDMSDEAWDDYGELSPYTLDQWYNDTKMNYGWELDELTRSDQYADASKSPVSSEYYSDPTGMIFEEDEKLTEDELRDFYNDIHDDDPVVSQYATFEDWLHDTVENGYLKKVDAAETVMSTSSEDLIMCHDDHAIDWDKLWEISDRYVTSTPLSGDWDTEVEHEQKAISEELGVSMEEAKHLMIKHLQFPPEVFEDASLVASTKVCSGVEVIDELGIDPNELWEIVDKYTSSTPVSGDWETETAAEQQEIADHFGISLEDAKRVMIDYLGFFNEDKFIEASDDVCSAESFENDPDMIGMTYDEISAAEDVDDEDDVEDVNRDTEEVDTVTVDDFYAHDLQGAIEKAIMEKVPDSTVIVDDDGAGEEGDEDYELITELYVTVTTPDADPEGRPTINDYTVPMEDLTGNIDEDVAYVLESIDELKGDSEEDEETKEED